LFRRFEFERYGATRDFPRCDGGALSEQTGMHPQNINFGTTYVNVTLEGAAKVAIRANRRCMRSPQRINTLNKPAGTADMATHVMAIINQKGGAGKTTLAMNLAAGLARRGETVVLDLDPQASSLQWASSGSKPFPATVKQIGGKWDARTLHQNYKAYSTWCWIARPRWTVMPRCRRCAPAMCADPGVAIADRPVGESATAGRRLTKPERSTRLKAFPGAEPAGTQERHVRGHARSAGGIRHAGAETGHASPRRLSWPPRLKAFRCTKWAAGAPGRG
jgi:hypothetical protein